MLEVLKLIQERQSGRVPYDSGRPVTKQDLRQILEAARWAPTPHNMQNFEVVIVDDKKLLESLGSMRRSTSGSFVQENYQNVDAYASSEEELLRKKVGLLVDTYEKVRSSQGRAIQTGPVLGVVTYNPNKRPPGSEGDFLTTIGLGCVLENMWLMAHSLGISFQVMSSLRGREKEVKKILDIPEYLKIAFGFRLGYAAHTPTKYLRVRREVEDFTHHNRFGNKSFD